MSPNGEVGGLFDIGKYPSVEEVEEDLKEIATAFPFLEFTIYMVDEVYEDRIEVDAEWEVKDGKVVRKREDFSVYDLEYTGMKADHREEYRDHLLNAENPENWWTLDELKELWKDKL